jgi:hypothetical protein
MEFNIIFNLSSSAYMKLLLGSVSLFPSDWWSLLYSMSGYASLSLHRPGFNSRAGPCGNKMADNSLLTSQSWLHQCCTCNFHHTHYKRLLQEACLRPQFQRINWTLLSYHHHKSHIILYLKYTAKSVERMASSRTFIILEYSSGETLARIWLPYK